MRREILILVGLMFLAAGEVRAENYYVNNGGKSVVYMGKGPPHVDKMGKLRNTYDGDSLFPILMYFVDVGEYGNAMKILKLDNTQSHDTLGELKKANYTGGLTAWWGPIDSELNHFDKMGMKLIVNIHDLAVAAANNSSGWTMDGLKWAVGQWKGHESVLAYHLFDEEPGVTSQNMSVEKWQKVYRAIKEADPDRLVFANGYSADDACKYGKYGFSDIIHFDRYVITGSDARLDELVSQVKEARGAGYRCGSEREKPLWVIIQTFMENSDRHWAMPSAAQVEAQMYITIVEGATGIWTFAQHHPWSNYKEGEPVKRYDQPDSYSMGINPQVTPDLWAEVSRINGQIQQYKQVWLAKTSSENYEVAYAQQFSEEDAPIRTLLKDVGDPNKRYLLAVNMRANPARTKITMSNTAVVVNSLLDGRAITPVGNSWIEDISGYGVRLYEIYSSVPLPGSCSNLLPPNCVNVGGSYTVSVMATNVSGVKFPTWDVANGQDDIVWYGGVRNGDSWSTTIKQSAHPSGDIASHAYRYDFGGNPIACGGGTVKICTTPIVTKVPTSIIKPTATPTKGTIKGDADGNGKVNVTDFAIWKTEYLTKSGTKSDFDKNGRVTIADFAIWKAGYLGGR